MTTTPTQDAVPSESARDLKFNAGKIDEFVTSMGWTYTDRFGVKHYTIEGLRWIAQQAISAFGYVTLDSFEDGSTLTLPNQVLRLEVTGEYYRWDGPLPKTVAPGSTPETTGGIGQGEWLSIGDAALRMMLASKVGYSSLGEFNSVADLRSYSAYASMTSSGRVYVKSYHAGLGYGGGFFRWNSASTDADDGGYTINPTGNAGPGRWKREFVAAFSARTVSPVEFGAKMNDGTFDSAPAINAAIAYLNPYLDASYDSHQGGDVVLPTAQYSINDTIYGAPNVRLIGTGGTAGFRFSRAGCTCIIAMSTMDLTKVMFDTAPFLKPAYGGTRYTRTDETIYGRTESDGYYGTYIENIVFIGQADTQCGIRIWRVVCPKMIGVAVYNCKQGWWFNGSWDISMRDCFSYGPKYAVIYANQCTTLHISHGYYTGNPTFLWAQGTRQWFHRPEDASNKPNIAYVTTFLYSYNTLDVTLTGTTIEGCNRDFAMFYGGPVNMFGGYTEHLGVAASETGHRVFAHSVACEFNSTGTLFNHELKDLAVQSGNLLESDGTFTLNERSTINIVDPHPINGFQNLTKDLGYGSYNIIVDSQHPITASLNTTIAGQRNYTVQVKNLLDNYTMRTPTITASGTTSFSFPLNNLANAGDYDVHFIIRNAGTTAHQDIRFSMLIGGVVTVTGYEARSRSGTATFAAPTITYDNAGTATVTFLGNSGNYSTYRVKCVPKEEQPLYIP